MTKSTILTTNLFFIIEWCFFFSIYATRAFVERTTAVFFEKSLHCSSVQRKEYIILKQKKIINNMNMLMLGVSSFTSITRAVPTMY